MAEQTSTATGAGTRAAEELIFGYLNRAVLLFEGGRVGLAEIDTAMRLGCGLPAGPFEMLDQVGLDTAVEVLEALRLRTGDDLFRPAPMLRRLVDQGRLGRAGGAGFHDYTGAAPAEPAAAGPAAAGARPVERIGLLGSGTMARGIAEALAVAGLAVTLVARTPDRAGQALDAIGASLAKVVRRGRISAEVGDRAVELIGGTDRLAELSDCDLVIEAVVEDLSVKRAVFGTLDEVCRPGAVLATTTSSLQVAECARATRRPGDVIGLHFFNPAPVMRLVEVVRTDWTGDDVSATAHALCARLGKTGVPCADTTGFIVNYLLFPYLNDAVRMVDLDGADLDEIDEAVRGGYGFPMGPFTLLDAVGLDVSLAIQRRLHAEFGGLRLAPAESLERLVAAGHLGRKTGTGFRVTGRR